MNPRIPLRGNVQWFVRHNQYFVVAILSRLFYIAIFLTSLSIQNKRSPLESNCNYDCKWYLEIASTGYSKPSSNQLAESATNWNFFPLFPYCARLISTVFHLEMLMSMYALNTLLTIAGLVFLGKYLEYNYGPTRSIQIVSLISFSPVNVYFMSGYSEALFFFLISISLYYLHKNQTYKSLLTLMSLSITRNTGYFIAVLLVTVFAIQSNRMKLKKTVTLIFICGIPLGIHMIFLKNRSGDYLAFVHAAKFYGVHRANLLSWLKDTLSGESLLQLIYLGIFIYCIAIFLYFLKKRMFVELVLLIPVIVTSCLYPYSTNWRYYLVLWPVYVPIVKAGIRRLSIFPVLTITTFSIFLAIAEYSWIRELGFMV